MKEQKPEPMIRHNKRLAFIDINDPREHKGRMRFSMPADKLTPTFIAMMEAASRATIDAYKAEPKRARKRSAQRPSTSPAKRRETQA